MQTSANAAVPSTSKKTVTQSILEIAQAPGKNAKASLKLIKANNAAKTTEATQSVKAIQPTDAAQPTDTANADGITQASEMTQAINSLASTEKANATEAAKTADLAGTTRITETKLAENSMITVLEKVAPRLSIENTVTCLWAKLSGEETFTEEAIKTAEASTAATSPVAEAAPVAPQGAEAAQATPTTPKPAPAPSAAPKPEVTPAPQPVTNRLMTLQEMREQAIIIARKHGIPPNVFLALINQESGWNYQAQSSACAIGLTQIMPFNVVNMGYDLEEFKSSPTLQLEAGARYLSAQFRTFKRWDFALAAYNAGPGAVTRYGGIPPYRETINYVRSIIWAAKRISV
ncbi:MAG: lytic transglycosylase domain-containing protein [Actinomycetota bacterium]|nr:lytic transglycosylase domain-containing protein [Actinomycetota bacterium]